jgi:hypothetical protein
MRWSVVAILTASAVIAGCGSVTDVGEPRDGVPVNTGPGGGSGGGGTAAEALVTRHCVWCHTSASPAAGIDLQAMRLSPAQWDAMGYGVAYELAPFATRLVPGDKRTLLDWIRARGGTVPAVTIPSTATWRMSDAIAGLPNGAPAPGFAFVIEDGYIDHDGWTVQTYTDRHGTTYKGIHLNQTHGVDQAIFSSSRNPSSYLVFPGIPWHGRFYDSRMEGDVRVGRWMSIGMHARDMTPTGRDHREYVRLQIDRDAISLRSAPTPLETWPWGDRPDPRLSGTTDASGFYQTSSEWLHFVLQARRTSDGVAWSARVTNPATGAVMADLAATERSANPLMGTFFLHAYSTGDDRMWANLVFSASIDRSN